MRLIQKTICRLMAFVLIIGASAVYDAGNNEAYALTVGESAFLYHYTDLIGINPVRLVSNGRTSGTDTLSEVVLSLPSTVIEKKMEGGTYTLAYAYSNGASVKVDFVMMPGNAVEVHYQILDGGNSPDNGTPRELLSLSGDTIQGVRYYENGVETSLSKTNDTQAGFNNAAMFPGAATVSTEVIYTLQQGGAIAFKLQNDEIIKLLWNTDNRIYYSTNQIKAGVEIYDFMLRGKTAGSLVYNYEPLDGAAGKTFQISTGYNTAAADNQISSRPLDKIDGIDRDETFVIDKTDASVTNEPADNPEIEIGFQIPQKWDWASKSFVTLTPPVSGPNPFPVGAQVRVGSLPVLIRDLLNNQDDPGTEGTVNYKYTYNQATESGSLLLYNLPPSTIYTGSTFTLYTPVSSTVLPGAYDTIKADNTLFGLFDVFTFPSYRVIRTDLDSYNIRVLNPYKNYTSGAVGDNVYGVYSVFVNATLGGISTPAATLNVQQGLNDKADTLTIPIPLTIYDSINPPYYYRVTFTPSGASGKTLPSQTVLYQQSETFDDLQIPEDFSVLSATAVTVHDPAYSGNDGRQDFVKVKFSFSTGLDAVLENLVNNKNVELVDYVFYQDETPRSADAEPFMTLRVPLVYPRENGKIVKETGIEVYQSESGDISLLSASYETFEKRVGGQLRDYGLITAEVLIPVAPKVNLTQTHLTRVFTYPNLYYASVMGRYTDKSNSDPSKQPLIETNLSNEDNLNVPAPADYAVPAPSSLSTANVGATSFDLNFRISSEGLFNYMDYILNPHKLTFAYEDVAYNSDAETSVLYNLYFGQDFAGMKDIAEAATPPGPAPGNKIHEVDFIWDTEIPFNEFNLHTGYVPEGYLSANEFIRDGGIYLIKGVPQRDFVPWDSFRRTASTDYKQISLTLLGLDDNTAYYAALNTVLVPYDTQWRGDDLRDIGAPKMVDANGVSPPVNKSELHPVIEGAAVVIPPDVRLFSGLTGLVTATTKAGGGGPSPDDYEPPAPTGLDASVNEAGGAEVYWNRLQQANLPAGLTVDKFEYEVLRIKADVLPDDFTLNKNTLPKVLSYISETYPEMDVAAWRTDRFIPGSSNELEELANNSGVNAGDVKYAATTARNTTTDGSITPGTMYVYYVRTLLKINPASSDDNNILKYSVWAPVSVTTAPIKGPVNLRAVQIGSFDPFKEVIVAFDAPVNINSIKNGDYSLIYSIKPDTGDWGPEITITPGSLTDGLTPVEEPAGFFTFLYKITGLEPSSSYMFRVRIKDNETGDKSVWSNVISHRTEFDPDQPDDDNDKWRDYFRQKLEELLKRPYWPILDNSESGFEAVYRSTMFDGVLGDAVDGVINLGKADVRNQVYYIPAKSFTKAMDSGKGFRITAGDVTLLVPPGVLDSQQTQAIRDITAHINDNKIKDYFVSLSLSLEYTSETINGNAALTDRIHLSVKTVGFEELEPIWDASITGDFKVLINDASALSRYYTRISNALKNGYTNEEMVRLIDEMVLEVDRDFIETVRRSFDDERQYEYEANVFASPVRLTAVPKQQAGQTSISGYQYVQGQWQSLPAIPFGTGRSIMPINPGIFIFSGVTVNIPGINEMQNGGGITNVVIKYGLDDFFGKGNSFDTVIPLTNDALTGAVARMAGASNTQDAAAYLREKGVNVSARNPYSPATNEVTVYMLMSLYEIKTNTKVSTIRITNHNIVKDIPGIGANYVPHYKAAYQIGIMDKKYMPKEQMTVKDFLLILGRLAGKINL